MVAPSFSLRIEVQAGAQIPAKKMGRSAASLNQAFPAPLPPARGSANRSTGTRQRLAALSHRRQWGESTFRTLVTPRSIPEGL